MLWISTSMNFGNCASASLNTGHAKVCRLEGYVMNSDLFRIGAKNDHRPHPSTNRHQP